MRLRTVLEITAICAGVQMPLPEFKKILDKL